MPKPAAGMAGMAGLGAVGDNAVLARLGLLDGKAVVGNRIQPGSFRREEFRFGNDGWSFWLVTSAAEAGQIAKKYARVKSAEAGREKNYGYATITAGKIRAIVDANGLLPFRIVADPQNPAHILVCRARDYSRLETREIRQALAAALGDIVVPE